VWFEKAAAASPNRGDIRENLAYTLLKTGDSDAAREQFGEAMRIEPGDLHLALEYAFLCYEARENAPARKAEARRIFAHVGESADAASRATAAQAFENIDAPLAAGIARWQHVLATSAPTFSAFYELAQLAEERDELELAASSYRAAFELLPARKSVLLELARVEKARGNGEGMMAALLAASRGGETRAAELAHEQLPDRYPYVYEFRKALELDPGNDALHRELAFLLLEMSGHGQNPVPSKDPAILNEAIQEFKRIVATSPTDYVAAAQLGFLYQASDQNDLAMPILKEALAHGDPTTANHVRMALKMPLVLQDRRAEDSQLDPLILGERSYKAGFMKDARRYYVAAWEQNPDPSIALKLGFTENMLHDDASAIRWFDIARRSNDPEVSGQARRAYNNLRPGVELFRTTLWVYPLYSSRWHDVFGYGQLKTELRLKKFPLHPYVSLRFVGDERRTTGGVSPQNLSESSFITGLGVATDTWHGALGWAEAGITNSYLTGAHMQDYRGGVSYSRTIGASLAAEHGGLFFEANGDSVFVSRFDDDLLNYAQFKTGVTSGIGAWKVQYFWSGNVTVDAKRQYWANFVETGPAIRFRPPHTPKSFWVMLSGNRGAYLVNAGNPRGPNYFDFRAGIWYAFSK
jgi:tetratricopeptide (TPR) repeat protein